MTTSTFSSVTSLQESLLVNCYPKQKNYTYDNNCYNNNDNDSVDWRKELNKSFLPHFYTKPWSSQLWIYVIPSVQCNMIHFMYHFVHCLIFILTCIKMMTPKNIFRFVLDWKSVGHCLFPIFCFLFYWAVLWKFHNSHELFFSQGQCYYFNINEQQWFWSQQKGLPWE